MTRLLWGLKESFADYVATFGEVTASDSAESAGDRFSFPAAPGDGSDGIERFTGRVEYRAHGGLLALVVRDPWLHRDGDGWFLTIDRGRGDESRTRIAALELLDSPGEAREFSASLADGAGYLFDHRYPVNEPLAPVRVE